MSSLIRLISIHVGKSTEFVSFFRVNIVGMASYRNPLLHRPVNVMIGDIVVIAMHNRDHGSLAEF